MNTTETEHKHVVIILQKENYPDDITRRDIETSTEYDETASEIMKKMFPEAKYSHRAVQTTGTIEYDNGAEIVLNEETVTFALIYVYQVNKEKNNGKN